MLTWGSILLSPAGFRLLVTEQVVDGFTDELIGNPVQPNVCYKGVAM